MIIRLDTDQITRACVCCMLLCNVVTAELPHSLARLQQFNAKRKFRRGVDAVHALRRMKIHETTA